MPPTLNNITLPPLTDYKEQHTWRGAMTEMADGSVAFDLVASLPKRTFTLTWRTLTQTQKQTLEAALLDLRTDPAPFTPPTPGAAQTTVTRTAADNEFVALATAAGLRWSLTLELREV
jgi:hypothetical protein